MVRDRTFEMYELNYNGSLFRLLLIRRYKEAYIDSYMNVEHVV